VGFHFHLPYALNKLANPTSIWVGCFEKGERSQIAAVWSLLNLKILFLQSFNRKTVGEGIIDMNLDTSNTFSGQLYLPGSYII